MVSESDTEDHERPAPPKRQCIQILNVNNDNPVENAGEEDRYLNDVEKIRKYHEYQIDRQCYIGTVDNTINRVMESYIFTPSLELSQLRLFREAEMEDRAVMMAIQNHGLQIESQSYFKNNDSIPQLDLINQNNYPKESQQEHQLYSKANECNPADIAPTSSKMPIFHDIEKKVKREIGKNDDGEEQYDIDIMERAVAEAIKIKGLSTLSVDYG